MEKDKVKSSEGKFDDGFLSVKCFSFIAGFNLPVILFFLCDIYYNFEIFTYILFAGLIIIQIFIGIILYSIYCTWTRYRLKNKSRPLNYQYALSGLLSWLLICPSSYLIAKTFYTSSPIMTIALLSALCFVSIAVAEFNCFFLLINKNKEAIKRVPNE